MTTEVRRAQVVEPQKCASRKTLSHRSASRARGVSDCGVARVEAERGRDTRRARGVMRCGNQNKTLNDLNYAVSTECTVPEITVIIITLNTLINSMYTLESIEVFFVFWFPYRNRKWGGGIEKFAAKL